MAVDDPVGRVYSYVQELFGRGVVIVVGSGASCSYDLPSMWDLAQHLLTSVPGRVTSLTVECQTAWAGIETDLSADVHLESALGSGTAPGALVDLITELIADCVRASEVTAAAEILAAGSVSAFGRVFEHVLRTSPVVDVITTNYDRLLEVHAARAGVRVDTMFHGHTVGRFNAELSREELCFPRTVPGRARNARLEVRPHVRLAKPHGSLDWFAHEDQIYRSDLKVPGARRIIAPGGSKYELGYSPPFSEQRTRANDAVTGAASMFFVGYGFNDSHLQTHLHPEIPTVVISKALSPNAKAYLGRNSSAVGIESADDEARCRVTQGADTFELDLPLWDLEHLAKDVLGI